MIKRIRDVKRGITPQNKISFKEWEAIRDRYAFAKSFIDKNPIYELLTADLQEAETILLENRIKEVHDIHTITETLKKVFITEKQVQQDELVGQIKYLRSLLGEIRSWITIKEQLEKDEADGKILIERNDKNESE